MQETIQKARVLSVRYRNHLVLLGVGGVGAASAQTTGTAGGAAAVQGLGLDQMISNFAAAIRTIISDNGVELMLVALPIIAWYFIRNNLRGSV